MRGIPLFNFPAFFEAEGYLRDHLKREVLNPARDDMEDGHFNPFTDVPTDEQIADFLARDFEMISACDSMVLLPGWEESVGAKKELRHYLKHRSSNDWKVYKYDPKERFNFRLTGLIPAELREYQDEDGVLEEMQQQLKEANVTWLTGLDPAQPQTVPEAYHKASGYLAGKKESRIAEKLAGSPNDLFRWDPTWTKETRTTSSTGGQKGVKQARYDLIPWDEIDQLAQLYGYGATKYEDRNWEKGYEFSKSYAALLRHLTAWWNGEDVDPEHQLSHMTSVIFHALALMYFLERHPQFDDRPKPALEEIQHGVYQPRWADSPDAHPVL
jgi:hypothetical protein